MKKKITYTSTLPADVTEAVNEYAEKYHVSKNAIVEQALRQFFFQEKRQEFRNGFRNALGDHEMLDLAEQGLTDYADIINRFDQKELK